MRSRRPALILLVVAVLLLGAISAAQRDGGSTSSTGTTTAAAPATTTSSAADVTATLPRSEPVRARPGDTVVLRVRSEKPDLAEILAVGAKTSVGPGLPGELRFVAPTAGDLPVDLEVAGTTAGIVSVSDPG